MSVLNEASAWVVNLTELRSDGYVFHPYKVICALLFNDEKDAVVYADSVNRAYRKLCLSGCRLEIKEFKQPKISISATVTPALYEGLNK